MSIELQIHPTINYLNNKPLFVYEIKKEKDVIDCLKKSWVRIVKNKTQVEELFATFKVTVGSKVYKLDCHRPFTYNGKQINFSDPVDYDNKLMDLESEKGGTLQIYLFWMDWFSFTFVQNFDDSQQKNTAEALMKVVVLYYLNRLTVETPLPVSTTLTEIQSSSKKILEAVVPSYRLDLDGLINTIFSHYHKCLGNFLSENHETLDDDYSQSFEHYQTAASLGEVSAMVALGRMYEDGLGRPKQFEEAKKWYLLAANDGYQVAYYRLAALFFWKREHKNKPEVIQWAELAEQSGSSDSAWMLGMIYRDWKDFKDDVKAIHYFKRAVDLGQAEAQDFLDNMLGIDMDVQKAKKILTDFFDAIKADEFYDFTKCKKILDQFDKIEKKGGDHDSEASIDLLKNLYYPVLKNGQLSSTQLKEELTNAFANLDRFLGLFFYEHGSYLRAPMGVLFRKESKACSIDGGFGDFEESGPDGDEKFVPDIYNNFHNDVFPYFKSNKRRLAYIRQLWSLMYVFTQRTSLDDSQNIKLIEEIKKDSAYKKYVL